MAKASARLVDWAESRTGERWTLQAPDSLEGNVIRAKDYGFTADGLKVQVGLREPWFSLNLHERLVDARKFYRLRLRARAEKPGSLELMAGALGGGGGWARPVLKVGTEWQTLEADLRRAPWDKGASWGGREGLIQQLCFRLMFPLGENVIVRLRDVALLGEGQADQAPPRIEPLPEAGGKLRFRVTDPAGVIVGSLQMTVNGLVYDLHSRALSWDGAVLSWHGRHCTDERLNVYVEAVDREGNRGGLELERDNPRLARGAAPPPRHGRLRHPAPAPDHSA